MSFEKQIEETLSAHSEWPGSADILWERVSAQLKKKKPWWQKRQLWMGTAAALLLVAFFLRPAFRPTIPKLAEKVPEVRLRSLSIPQKAPLPASPGGLVGLPLEASPLILDQGASPNSFVSLLISRVTADGRIPLQKKSIYVSLGGKEQSSKSFALIVPTEAPWETGLYHLEAQGIVFSEGKPYLVRGETEVEVQENGKGR